MIDWSTFNRKLLNNTMLIRITIPETFSQMNPNYELPEVNKSMDGSSFEKLKTNFNNKVKKPEDRTNTELDDDYALLSSPVLYGFSLSDKLWCMSIILHFTSMPLTTCVYSGIQCGERDNL